MDRKQNLHYLKAAMLRSSKRINTNKLTWTLYIKVKHWDIKMPSLLLNY